MTTIAPEAPNHATQANLKTEAGSQQERIRRYLREGIQVIPIPHRQKAPNLKGWRDLRFTEADVPRAFPQSTNIGALLGEPSAWLVDIDLDAAEAVELAPYFLPSTRTFGRTSRRCSHWLFYSEGLKTRKFASVEGNMLVEVRSTGCQTVFPGSIHVTGEPIEFNGEAERISIVEPAVLLRCVEKLAAAVLLARAWPQAGQRHEASLALSGSLLRNGYSEPEARQFVMRVAEVAGDEEAASRVADVESTARRLANGETAHGLPSLRRLLGGKVIDNVHKWLFAESASVSRPATSQTNTKPRISVGTDEGRVIDEAEAALATDEQTFQRAGMLVRVTRRSNSEAPEISKMAKATLRERLARCANWQKQDSRTGTWRPAHPPDWTVDGLSERGVWPRIRVLEAVVETPVIKPSGSLVEVPGYDGESRLLYLPIDTPPQVPRSPTLADAQRSRDELLEVVADFPFAGEEDRSAWLAAVLTQFARHQFDGHCPLTLVVANTRGSGKGLLIDTISVIGTGRTMARMANTSDDTEMRKRLLSIALAGTPQVLIDNVVGSLGTPSFDMALTAGTVSDRVLGSNKFVTAPLKATWFATGNNVELNGDTPRRTLAIRLSSPLERPEERTSFRQSNLLQWLQLERSRLVVAALTILRAFSLAGRPQSSAVRWGSFENWQQHVCSAVSWVGLPAPEATRVGLEMVVGSETSNLRALLLGLHGLSAESASASKLLAKLARTNENTEPIREALRELAPSKNGDLPNTKELGYLLRRFRGRIVGGLRLENESGRSGVALWRVVRVGGDGGDTSRRLPSPDHSYDLGTSIETGGTSPPSPLGRRAPEEPQS